MLRWAVECGTVAGVWFLGGAEAAFWAGACLVLLARTGGIGVPAGLRQNGAV
jgi:hypothetical protein